MDQPRYVGTVCSDVFPGLGRWYVLLNRFALFFAILVLFCTLARSWRFCTFAFFFAFSALLHLFLLFCTFALFLWLFALLHLFWLFCILFINCVLFYACLMHRTSKNPKIQTCSDNVSEKFGFLDFWILGFLGFWISSSSTKFVYRIVIELLYFINVFELAVY